MSKIAHSTLVSVHRLPIKNTKSKRRISDPRATEISIIRLPSTGISAMRPVTPRTSKIFMILLPIIFPNAISDCLLSDAIIEVTSSGALVPNATIVSQITAGETQNDNAICVADDTRSSAHTQSPISPKSIIQIAGIVEIFGISEFCSTALL